MKQVDNITAEKYCNDIGILDSVDMPATGDLSSTGACSPGDGQTFYGMKARVDF
ncbi:MAG: hypothetical protein GDA35_05035 [Hyphomonadaceae bacterium]|nr:hypothetical protein [Hyphomonadaceae bacterium]